MNRILIKTVLCKYCFKNTHLPKKILKNEVFHAANYSTTIYKSTDTKTTENIVKKDLIPNPHDDPNIFGSLSKKTFINKSKFENDEGDQKEKEKEFRPYRKKLSTKQYADIIKDFLKQNQLKEALNILEIRMLKEDRVNPESYIYSLLIGACGRVGYTKKAFELFNNMKKRGLKVHPGAYTGLFNACANSPWKEDGLSRAIKLQELINDKNYLPNDSNYHAMIKAFGRLSDLPRAFAIVDEMITKRVRINSDTMNFLFQACISSQNDGFRYALLVWRKMLQKNIKPNIYSFNLLLRTVRDCDLGDQDEANKLIQDMIDNPIPNRLIRNSSKSSLSDKQIITLSVNDTNYNTNNEKIELSLKNHLESDPNLSLNAEKEEIVKSLFKGNRFSDDKELQEKNPNESNLKSSLSSENDELLKKPLESNLKSSLSLEADELLKNSSQSDTESSLNTRKKELQKNPLNSDKKLSSSQISILDIKENRPNLLAKQPNLGNIIALNDVKKPEDRLLLLGGMSGFLNEMQIYGINPDIKTFTQLLDCIPPTRSAEKQLMATMKIMKIAPDVDFFNMLIKKRSMRFDHEGGKDVLYMIDEAGYKPDLITYGVLAVGCKTREEAIRLFSLMEVKGYRVNSEILGAMLQQACYRNDFGYIMHIMELSLKHKINPNQKFMEHLSEFRKKCLKMFREKTHHEDLSERGYFQSGFKLFNARYQTWKAQVKIDESEESHPWEQFRTTLNTTNSQYYKDPQTHFKPRHLSRFKVKTSTKIRY